MHTEDRVLTDKANDVLFSKKKHSFYRDNFYQWVNEILVDAGNVSLTELSKRYDLPLDVITKVSRVVERM